MAKKAAQGRKKKANGYVMPDPMPLGLILKDSMKKEWCLGPSIGKGGFGEIYSACEAQEIKSKKYPYAVKIEPQENGPLYVEQSFFLKVLKKDYLEAWKTEHGLKFLAVPTLQGFGSHTYKDKNYRFLVMEKFGKDVWSMFLSNNKKLPTTFILNVALQIIDALEYIHSKEYVHGDIKGANLLCSLKKGEDKVYLLDFGLARKYSTKENFEKNPKFCNDGTIEYLSRDMHMGVHTRRSDMEILGFNLLHWLSSSLPWENISDHAKVAVMKNEFMDGLKKKSLQIPLVLKDYFTHLTTLGHLEEPNYDYCKEIFSKALKNESRGNKSTKSPPKRGKATTAVTRKKKKKVDSPVESENESEDETDENDPEELQSPEPVKRGRAKKTENECISPKKNWKEAPANLRNAKLSEVQPNENVGNSIKRKNLKVDKQGTKTELKKTKKTSNVNSNTDAKVSWRDFPTCKSSLAILNKYK